MNDIDKRPAVEPPEENIDDLPELEPVDDEQPVGGDFAMGQVIAEQVDGENIDDLPELEAVDEELPTESAVEAAGDDIDALPELEAVQDDVETHSAVAMDRAGAEAQIPDDIDDLPELEPAEPYSVEGTTGLSGPPEAADLGQQSDDGEESSIDVGSYRKLYETQLHALPRDVRIETAHTAKGEVLCALCLDSEAAVIRAVLDNPEVGLRHARLIAEHHRSPVGLDSMGRRVEFLRDATVRRMLMRNNQAPDPLLKKSLAMLTLHQTFRDNMGHENSERARRAAREVLREKFLHSTPEERVGLVLRTEGRCLSLLPGVTFDQKMTALLCSKTYQSTLLIQGLARFPALPPVLVGTLMKQPIVQRSPQLKKMLMQHKNCPSLLKR
jgi:hypothetical protein